MKPKIYTSYRSHGKWGDFLACIVPTIWCFNILVNSSFILKLLEWQNESSIFTVRIRGRQWYWVYKFELKNVIDLISVPKKISWNKWIVNTGNSIEISEDYFFSLKIRAQNNWLTKYWKNFLKNLKKYKKNNNNFFLQNNNFFSKKNNFLLNTDDFNFMSKFSFFKKNYNLNFEDYKIYNEFEFNFKNNLIFDKINYFFFSKKNIKKIKTNKYINIFNKNFLLNKKQFKNLNFNISLNLTDFNFDNSKKFININLKKIEFNEFSRFTKKKIFEKKPILLTKNFITNSNLNNNLLSVNFDIETSVEKKINNDLFFLTLKQKRYKRKKNIPLRIKYFKDELNQLTKKIKFSDKPYLFSNKIIKNLDFEPTNLYRVLKKNKIRSENFSTQLSRRLLRTKKTLVLPAHVNITLISNSYDVIHSWFIPALGIKIDCVPGRATHHSFFCDSVGFYYGQCAEICGRYHHHMPIRLCVLTFEHFLVWWQHFGLPKLLFTESRNRFETDFGLKKFVW